jgi:hypothetical protein
LDRQILSNILSSFVPGVNFLGADSNFSSHPKYSAVGKTLLTERWMYEKTILFLTSCHESYP